VRALGFDCGHIARGEKSFFVVAVRYSILVVVNAVAGDLVVGAGWGFVWAQDCIPCLGVNCVWLAGHTQREPWVCSRFAV